MEEKAEGKEKNKRLSHYAGYTLEKAYNQQSKDGYIPYTRDKWYEEFMGPDGGEGEQGEMIPLTKNWYISSYVYGYVYLDGTSTPLENIMVSTMVESVWFQNRTLTNETGFFCLGIYVNGSDDYDIEYYKN